MQTRAETFISFVFSSRFINEFFKIYYLHNIFCIYLAVRVLQLIIMSSDWNALHNDISYNVRKTNYKLHALFCHVIMLLATYKSCEC
jgi:hypothetical protein